MPQVFGRSANTISRVSLIGLFLLVGVVLVGSYAYLRSSPFTNVGVVVAQPVQFSHRHHVTDAGIDCRYCHTSVETSAVAGIPAFQICMNCHTQIWAQSPKLEPVRQAYATGQSFAWNKVYVLPEFVYFDHSIHVRKGMGCSECHGRIDQMPLTYKVVSLQMGWCLECHRNPEQRVRPREEVYNSAYQHPANQAELGRRLVEEYGIRKLTSCSVCHR